MKLTKVEHIGYWYFHRFIKNGVEFDVETTKEDYLQLGKKNPVNPKSDGAQWVCSFEAPKFSTSSGHIEEGTFCEIASENGNILAKPVGKKASNLKREDFVDFEKGELRQDVLDKLK